MSRMQTVNFVAINAARDQALKLGAGFVRILPDGGWSMWTHGSCRSTKMRRSAEVTALDQTMTDKETSE